MKRQLNSIVIIGTRPPCPRCKLLTKVVTEKVKELKLEAGVRHLTYTDAEAKEYAGDKGLEMGTAKDVARRIGEEIDLARINEIIKNAPSGQDGGYRDYNDCNWSFELDEFLRPFEKKAKEAGILMTPVLIINGKLKHQGSVPEMTRLEGWLRELKKD